MAGAKFIEEVFVLSLAGAENNQLNALLNQAFRNAANKVNALMADQAGNHSHDRASVLVQTELILKGCLAGCFALLERVDVIVFDNVRVSSRIIDIHVNAVEDAAQLILLLAQQSIQAMAEPRVKDFPRIGGADRGDLVGSLNGALHKVGTAVIFHDMRITLADTAGIFKDFQTVLALVGNIVDREHRLDTVELIQMAVIEIEINRGQCRLPVIAVDNIRFKIGVEQHLKDCAGEEGEALTVIVETVKAAALEIVFVVDKVEGDAIAFSLEQSAVLAAPANGNAEIGDIGQGIAELKIPVKRQNHTAVNTVTHQSLGQSAGHIGQTAGFGKRCSLAGSIKNFHVYLLKTVPDKAPVPNSLKRAYKMKKMGRGCTRHSPAPLNQSPAGESWRHDFWAN